MIDHNTATKPGPIKPPHSIIRASAGTGKTFSLSNRYLALLRRDAKPQTILATTFTRKAAGEILQRVLVQLAEAASDETHAQDLRSHIFDDSFNSNIATHLLHDLTDNLHRTTIATIDSFFHSMAMCFRHELKLTPGMQVIDEQSPLAMQLRRQAIDAVLGDDDPQLLVDLLRRLHHDKMKRSVTQAIDDIVSELYEYYQLTFGRPEPWHQLEVPQAMTRDELVAALTALQQLLQNAPGKRIANALNDNYTAAIAGNWKVFLQKGLAKPIFQGTNTYYGKPIDNIHIELFTRLINHANAIELAYVAHQTQASYQLLKKYDEQYTQLRQANNVILYSDIPLQLADKLLNRKDLLLDLYYRLDTRVTHLMLDEFQDTSPTQWNILKPFAKEITSQGKDYADRTFFCVGDTKQAIYGWRGGTAKIFNKIEKDLHLDDESLKTLDKSWRSSQTILDVVNTVFTGLPGFGELLKDHHPTLANWKNNYILHEAARPELPGYVLFATTSPPGEKQSTRDAHDQSVAAYVQQLVEQSPQHDIGVLVRTRKAVNRLVHAIRKLGIEASGEGANPLTDDPAVSIILSAMTLADHPGHKSAAFHVLNSPLAKVIGLQNINQQHCLEITQPIRKQLLTEGYAATITQWAKKIAPHCNEQTTDKLQQLIELADQYQPSISLRPSHFVDFISQTDVEQPSASQVRVMTIHKSKGLEFDIVVLPELNKSTSHMLPNAAYVARKHPTGPITAVYRATRKEVRAASEQLQQAYLQQQARILDDNLCALYVAMTRPRHALYMLVEPLQETAQGKISTLGNPTDGYATILRETLDIADEEFNQAQILYTHGDEQWFKQPAAAKQPKPPVQAPPHIKLNITNQHPTRFITHATPSSMEDAGRIHVSNILRLDENTAALRGTAIHELFATIDWLDQPADQLNQAKWLEIVRRDAPQMNDQWHQQVIVQFAKIIDQPNVKQMLRRSQYNTDEQNLALLREHPFVVEYDNQLLNGSFDRVVIEHHNNRPSHAHLIDFKTDTVADDHSNLDELGQRYQPQIKAYRHALQQLYNLPQGNITSHLLLTGADIAYEI